MGIIRVSSKGRIVIPRAIRDVLDIRSGTELQIELLTGDGFKVTVRTESHAAKVSRLAGSLAHLGNGGRYSPVTDDEAVLQAVGKDDRRIRRYVRSARRARR